MYVNIKKLIREAIDEIGETYVDQYGDLREKVKNKFGWISPKETFESRVKSFLSDIIMEEHGISEKNFTGVDQAIREVRRFFEHSERARALLDELKSKDVRHRYAAEVLYNQWGDLNELHDDDGLANMNEESSKKLKDNKVKLTDEERAEVIVKGATWDDGTPGVWKSKDKNGNVQYCSNTHRAMAVSTTLAAAIKKFPDIKSTS